MQRVVVLSTLDLFLGYPAAFKIDHHWRPLPTTEPHQLGPHITEFVAREFVRGSPLSVTVARLGQVLEDSVSFGHPSSAGGRSRPRFWILAAAAAAQLLELVTTPGPVDVLATHHHPGRYRVVHLLDPSCEFLPAEAEVDTAAAIDALAVHVADAAAAGPAASSSVEKVLLLGANGMLGPPVRHRLCLEFCTAFLLPFLDFSLDLFNRRACRWSTSWATYLHCQSLTSTRTDGVER